MQSPVCADQFLSYPPARIALPGWRSEADQFSQEMEEDKGKKERNGGEGQNKRQRIKKGVKGTPLKTKITDTDHEIEHNCPGDRCPGESCPGRQLPLGDNCPNKENTL